MNWYMTYNINCNASFKTNTIVQSIENIAINSIISIKFMLFIDEQKRKSMNIKLLKHSLKTKKTCDIDIKVFTKHPHNRAVLLFVSCDVYSIATT